MKDKTNNMPPEANEAMQKKKQKVYGKGHVMPENPMKIFGRILGMMWKSYKVPFIFVIICLCVSAGVSVFASAFLKPLIDDYIVPLIGQENPDFTPLALALLKVAGIYLIAVVASFLQNRLMIKVSNGTLSTIRETMFANMQRLPIKYFDTHKHGDIMSVYTNDTDTMREFISRVILQIISASITIVGTLFTMFSYSWLLTLIVLAVDLASISVVRVLGTKSGHFFMRRQQSLGKVNGYVEEHIGGQRVIKVFNHEKICVDEFNELAEQLRKDNTSASAYANILMPIMSNIGNILYVIIAFVGSFFAIKGIGGLTLGIIGSFLLLSKSFTQTISQLSQLFNTIVMALAGADRVFKLMDEQPEVDDGNVTLVMAKRDGDKLVEDAHGDVYAWKKPTENGEFEIVELKGDVRFNDVYFSYDGKTEVLKDLNVFAKPGQKLAFIGETGAGKTTITNLINRFYDVDRGEIVYDGINVKDIKKDDLRHTLGIVLQDTNLFTGTVADNIRFGKLDATDEEVVKAAKLANAHFFISALPDGYNTVISGSGDNLSQGQRQLLAIARAAIANPPVLILDEATSSIDTRTEKIIGKGIDKLMNGRTVFVIAHRLSTVRDSNAIIVLSHGEVIERGNHETLIAEKGQYYRFYTGAFELD